MRSKLFVPGARPELFAKALAGDADALSFDLEDSVPLAGKAAARREIAAFLGGPEAKASGKKMIVRSNPADSPEFEADLAAVIGLDIDLLNIPKVESPGQLLEAIARIARAEARAHAQHRLSLLVTIETPGGLRRATDIAAAHPRVAGLQLGLGDLFEPLGIQRDDARNLHAVLFALRMAAAEAGVFVLDGAHPAIDDASAFEAEAGMARNLGYLGKSCIHPRQVAWANRIFQPSEAELARARQIVEASLEAQAAGRAAFRVDGRMVDPPYLARAHAVLGTVGESSK